MVRLSGINLYMKKMEMEDEGFIPIGLDTGTDMGDFEDEKDSKIFRNPYLFDMDFSIFFHSCANNSATHQRIQTMHNTY